MYCISSAILLTKIKLRTDYVCQFGFLTKYSQTVIQAKENIFDEKQKKKMRKMFAIYDRGFLKVTLKHTFGNDSFNI